METKCGSHSLMVSTTCVPSLDILEQQTTAWDSIGGIYQFSVCFDSIEPTIQASM